MNILAQNTGTQTRHKGEAQQKFLTYVRTKEMFNKRLRRCASGVNIPVKQIEKEFFIYPMYDRKTELKKLVDAGQLLITDDIVNDRKTYFYQCLVPGEIDVSLIETQNDDHYKPLHYAMREMLLGFFRVDTATGRVYTPVTNFHKTHRPNILLDGCKTIGFDVAQMQPLLLGKILSIKIGPNEYSEAISEGKDIYEVIAHKANLESREAGKKRFFEIIFAPANDDLVKLFGAANWIQWINDFKRIRQPNNPKTDIKRYGNMAWALTLTEVQTMFKVWNLLYQAGINFLTVHDEIIVKEHEGTKAEGIFRAVLDKEFTSYKLNTK